MLTEEHSSAESRSGVDPSAWLDARLLALEGEGQAFHRATLAQLDRDESFPECACRALDEMGLARHYVPADLGGALDDFNQLGALWRTVARRDLTVAIAHGKTFLGCICCWIAGTFDQRGGLAELVAHGAVVAWGLTEKEHGSDLLAGEVRIEAGSAGFLLNGVKWPINNARRARLMVVLGRTKERGGGRGMSLLLVDKTALAAGTFECLEKELTHGIRGADISGICFRNAVLPATALLGPTGAGIETVLRALQLTRTASVGLSLGALDQALELALAFTSERTLYGRRLIELPHVRRVLGEAAAARLVAEVVSTVASRSVHTLPEELALTAAITKGLVPTLADQAIANLGELLGARAFLCDVFAHGRFQKLQRDHRIVPIFDGSSVVNRHATVNHFPMLSRRPHERAPRSEGLAAAITLAAPLPPLAFERLRLVSRSCSVLDDLDSAAARLDDAAGRGDCFVEIAALARDLAAELGETRRAISTAGVPARQPDTVQFALAERVELCWAGAACLAIYGRNEAPERRCAPRLWDRGLWLRGALNWIVARLQPFRAPELYVFEEIGALLGEQGREAVASLFPQQRGGSHSA
jgi:alkylation response protein AidB-like acyl-CoA dehydrogenase